MKIESFFKKSMMVIKNKGFFILFKKIIFQIFLILGKILKINFPISIIINRYKKGIKSANSIEEIYESIINFKFLAMDIRPLQVKEEILKLLDIIHDLNPNVIVEIGTNKGGTLSLLCNVTDSNSHIISIDLFQGEFGGGYPPWKIPIYKSFAKNHQKIDLIHRRFT